MSRQFLHDNTERFGTVSIDVSNSGQREEATMESNVPQSAVGIAEAYRPMMTDERVQQLRELHEFIVDQGDDAGEETRPSST